MEKGFGGVGAGWRRIRRLREAADFAIYTPGSTAGLPVSVLGSFTAPGPAIIDDAELFRDRVSATSTSLLALLGIEADPVQSREHILLSTVLATAWKQGQSLDLAELIRQIQKPPVARVGVVDLESFFPAKDRFALAMSLNNLLASPGFDAWMQGDPLDPNQFFFTGGGKPRVSIFSIAHLNDTERMFFVSLLLNQILGWVRAQPGTTSLRALVYMDEIFGYFPPVANPPSKLPLLTLLKQARAFGVGLVLATQNPVDLDYKGLSNAGTWFLGRLQTDRDKARVLDGLEGASTASGGFDRKKMEQMLASLGKRVFLMHNVNDDAPTLFQVRWAMSYLRGPLTRTQIKVLMDPTRPAASAAPAPTPASPAVASPTPPAVPISAASRPLLPPEITQLFVPLRETIPAGSHLQYRPVAFGCGRVDFTDTKAAVDETQEVALFAPLAPDASGPDWATAKPVELTESDLEHDAAGEATFAAVPQTGAKPKSYEAWKKSLADVLYRTRRIELFKSPTFGNVSKPGEGERDFRVRIRQRFYELRDEQSDALRKKYTPKVAAIEERIRRAEQAVAREAEQANQSYTSTAISFGTTVLGAFLGRKKITATTVGKASSAARGVGRSMKESKDIDRAKETVEALRKQRDDLEAAFKTDLAAIEQASDPAVEELDTVAIKPKKNQIAVRLVALAWAPYLLQPDGTAAPAWE